MPFPVYLPRGSLKVHPHVVFETLAYAIAFRVYAVMRKRAGDAIDDADRWWVIAAAAVGAVVGCNSNPRPVISLFTSGAAFYAGSKLT